MSVTGPQQIKAKLTKAYGAGIVVFVVIFGSLSLAWLFFTHLKT